MFERCLSVPIGAMWLQMPTHGAVRAAGHASEMQTGCAGIAIGKPRTILATPLELHRVPQSVAMMLELILYRIERLETQRAEFAWDCSLSIGLLRQSDLATRMAATHGMR